MTLDFKKNPNKKIVFSTSDDDEPKVKEKPKNQKKFDKKGKFDQKGKFDKKSKFDQKGKFDKKGKFDSKIKSSEHKSLETEDTVDDTIPDENKTIKIDRAPKNKIRFGNDSDEEDEPPKTTVARQTAPVHFEATEGGDENKKWFQVYPDLENSDVMDMKDKEQGELYSMCQAAFEEESAYFSKKNPQDAKWLETAMHKGTSKDRANAGALLVTSNPLGNLQALQNLVGFTKLSNKASTEAVNILCDLFMEVLLPPHRKLNSLQVRGSNWKALKKANLQKERQRRILAYWHFENELKDQYFEFLKNLQLALQNGQENNKTASISAASKLLKFAPEKEQMLLTMLINKLGDPVGKIASKSLHHLSDVAYKHPNMCLVIVQEAEKLLFRNNISERAQHFTLCFLGQIAPTGNAEVCTKLVNICFALFKVLVQKGAINNRTMQAILRCLQKAIVDAQPPEGSTEIISKDMEDTIYRLVHLADIRISIQTLSLLLQMVGKSAIKSDRFYNALYKKMLDLELVGVGNVTSANFLHILHKAIHVDTNVPRALAFIKRLLQLSLYLPANVAAGCMIIINKILKMRKELLLEMEEDNATGGAVDTDLSKFDDDDEEEVYKDADDDEKTAEEPTAAVGSSWHHAKLKPKIEDEAKAKEISVSKYDAYHRNPSFAGAEYAQRAELLLLGRHYHPTVQLFAENILLSKRISYYGDPLRDFSLAHFLERFAFKNPKKLEKGSDDVPGAANKTKQYMSYGARGRPVKELNRGNCTEDERFIFQYLEKKRATQVVKKKAKDDEEDAAGDVDDDEFEAYLDNLGVAGGAADDEEDFDEEFKMDYLKEIGGELKDDPKKKTKKKSKSDVDDDEDMEDIDKDWGDDAEEEAEEDEDSELDDDDDASIEFDEDDDNDQSEDEKGSIDGEDDELDDGSDFSEGEDDDEPKAKRSKKSGLSEKAFNASLKRSNDISSLFASADDFADLLEENSKIKGQGTSGALFNKDKSSDKQLKWEEKRRSNYKGDKFSKKNKMGGGGKFKNKNKRK